MKQDEPTLYTPPRGPRDYVGLVARGFAMGAADVVPGVSGGTMAFILGIYEELIRATREITQPSFLRPLLRGNLKAAAEALPWPFLCAVFAGILLAVFSLAPGLEWLLENQPALLWSFFFGLVLASILTVSARVGRWTTLTRGGVILGTIGAWLIVGMVPVQTPDAPWFLVLSGSIAICAMVLPGISGSFILVLMGKYQQILAAVTERDLVTIATFAFGAGIGLLLFARFLSWLLARYHDVTVSLLIGLMAGSLRKVWPWKETLESMIDRHGKSVPVVERNILPSGAEELALGVGLALVGAAIVLVLERANRAGEDEAA